MRLKKKKNNNKQKKTIQKGERYQQEEVGELL